ncbi:MAG: hypothetical protein AMS21_00695 [Gemmatimonas sp. SG8_38_2]|nr:MAG: hypothetical protein AMS21_00695 [Gemmatimonas sp. SG8_38_2]
MACYFVRYKRDNGEVIGKYKPTQAHAKFDATRFALRDANGNIDQTVIAMEVDEETYNSMDDCKRYYVDKGKIVDVAVVDDDDADDSGEFYTHDELMAMSKAELIAMADEHGLDASGTKDDLAKRLCGDED